MAETGYQQRVGDREDQQRLWWDMVLWLYHEAELLDEGRFDEWLELLTDDIAYEAPVRLTKELGQGGQSAFTAVGNQYHFLENRYSLQLRVDRLHTDFAWAEDPPSRTRRFVSNVRVTQGETSDAVSARSYLLLYRNRGDDTDADLISAERRDEFRYEQEGWKLARRFILLDQGTLATKNLGVML